MILMRVLESIESGPLLPEAWDELVAGDERGHLLQTWAWGELKRAFGWMPVRLAIERDGALAVGAQILYRRIGPFSLGYIPKGPVLPEEDPQLVEMLMRAIHARARRMCAISLKVEPEWREGELQRRDWLADHGFRPSQECIQPRSTIMVDLDDAEEQILARMKPKWRYNIRLSERKGVEVREGDTSDLEVFYELMRVTGRRDGFSIHSLDYYRRAFELFQPAGHARLFMAYYQDRPLAGLMAYAFNKQSWYMYGASADEHRELMSNHQLQWCAMKWARALGCKQYDLWGVPDTEANSPTATLEGVGRFKAGFGGQIVRYLGAYDYVYLPPLYWLMNKAWEYRRAQRPTTLP
jgi:lipid II:glycine glycyltransferase (peptidoglycan interpeptide bridge formation enzyme)